MATTTKATDSWHDAGFSLANVGEVLFACLDAIAAKSVAEIGAHRGELTRELLSWAAGRGARVTAIEPMPPAELLELSEQHPELELVRETSRDALRHLPRPDALIVDGDHNYYTVSEELRLIEERAPEGELPLLMFHDVGWPHARRDGYYAPDQVPEEHRQPLAHNAALAPWEPGVADGGLRYRCAAQREGGPRNGVLTAIEDFVGEREGLRLATVSAFFGLGVMWHEGAPWASAVAEIVQPWNRNPLVERLEANRVAHLVERYRHAQLLRVMLESRAFAWAEWLSRLRHRGRPLVSREQVRRVLDAGHDGG